MSTPVRRFSNTPYQVTVPDYREPISGLVATAMPEGALVEYKQTLNPQDDRELVAANGGRPAILESEVMTDVNWQSYLKVDPAYRVAVRMPVPVNSFATARFAHFAEFEGAAYFDGITNATAVDTPLTTLAGKFKAAVVGTDEVVGYLSRKLTPHESTSFRWEVRFA